MSSNRGVLQVCDEIKKHTTKQKNREIYTEAVFSLPMGACRGEIDNETEKHAMKQGNKEVEVFLKEIHNRRRKNTKGHRKTYK